MPFKERNFNEPTYQVEEIEERRLILISCEGKNTEPEYFEALKKSLGRKLSTLVEVDVIPNIGQGSNPQDVLANLETRIRDEYQFRENFDSLWLVVDREKVDDRKRHLMSIQPECLQKGYGIALSNPTFELWLLMHVADLSEFSDDELFENAYQTQAKNRRFLDKTLSELLGGYNKKAGRFPTTILSDGNLQRALEQQNKMDTSFETLLDQLGTNVGDILIALLDGVEE